MTTLPLTRPLSTYRSASTTSLKAKQALGHNRPRGYPVSNHYVSELLLICVGRIAAREVETIVAGLERKPARETSCVGSAPASIREVDSVSRSTDGSLVVPQPSVTA